MPLSPVALCNRALLKIGAQPIQDFDDDRIESDIALSFYEPIRDAMLSAYPWRFAVAQVTLSPTIDIPLADYSHVFELPEDCLRVLSLGGLNYRRIGNTLHCSSETVVLDYIFRPEDSIAPAYFELALIARLASEFCLPLTENTSRAEMLYRMANIEFENAKRIDAQQDTPRALDDFSLLNARQS